MVRQFCYWATLIGALVALSPIALADEYDPPPAYYSDATGTGATLKSQLTTAMSTGHIQRTYGNFTLSAAISDADPNTPGNILLVYNRASVPATWDFGSTWNREHLWPDSFQPQDADNEDIGAIADPHMLRPCNPGINSSRGNQPYGFDGTTGSYGSAGSGYYYPGDTDKGDVARSMLYAATRWSSTLTLTDNFPTGNQMGDLSSLIAWHYLDVPDEFERRRNHVIYSQAENPSYYTNNRNAYIDRPEFAWSVYVDQMNDSQITISGGTPTGNGGTTRDVDLGTVFVGGSVPAAQNFTLNKGGNDGTYYEVAASGDATSSILGRYNAFRTNGTDSESITVGSSASTASAGLKSGTVTVNNLDVTTLGGAGNGANDANDQFNVSLTVLDHATPSFSGSSEDSSLVHNFGFVELGSTDPTFMLDIFNLETTFGFTADLDFDSVMVTGDTGSFSADFAAAAGSLTIAADDSQGFEVSFDTDSLGSFSATYTLTLSDEDFTGAESTELTLMVTGHIVAEGGLVGDYNGDGKVSAADFTVWRDKLGTEAILNRDPENEGPVGIADFESWKENYGVGFGAGSGFAASAVPEPTAFWLTVSGLIAISCARPKARRCAPCEA